MSQPKVDLYDVLGVSKSASPDEIKKAFRKKAISLHPDKHGGDKEKEQEFKKVNEAYAVLSDVDKRAHYDKFGVIDDIPGGSGGGVDISEIFKGMFGGMGGPMGGDFSFVFMDGHGGGPVPGFSGMFPGDHPPPRSRAKHADCIEIPIDICDIYYGKTRKVEFEMLDLCSKCNGCGAQDPSHIIKCLGCGGQGSIHHQMGPFFVQSMTCTSCGGKGTTIKQNKTCLNCKGNKTVYTKRSFELKIPKGIPNNHELRMEDKGSYDERIKKNKDIVFRFRYDIKSPYDIDEDNNVVFTVNIPIEDLLAGFDKHITVYNEDICIKADHYVNPKKRIVVPGMGIANMRKGNAPSNLILNLKVEFGEGERLIKYADIIRKVLKKKDDGSEETPTNETSIKKIINLTS